MPSSIEQYLEVLHAKRRAPVSMKVIGHVLTLLRWPCSLMWGCMCRRSAISNCVTLTSLAGRSRSGVARQARLVVSGSMLMRSACCVGISMSFVAQQECLPSGVTRNGSCSWSESMLPGEGIRPPQESPSESCNEWCNSWGNVQRNNSVLKLSMNVLSKGARNFKTWCDDENE